MMGKQQSQGQHKTSEIMALHLIVCLVLLGLMTVFAWRHHPVRNAWRSYAAGQEAARKEDRARNPNKRAPMAIGKAFGERITLFWPLIWPDLALGGSVWCLFFMGTWAVARRADIWFEMHGSGQAAGVRGIGIDAQALGANKGRMGGEL